MASFLTEEDYEAAMASIMRGRPMPRLHHRQWKFSASEVATVLFCLMAYYRHEAATVDSLAEDANSTPERCRAVIEAAHVAGILPTADISRGIVNVDLVALDEIGRRDEALRHSEKSLRRRLVAANRAEVASPLPRRWQQIKIGDGTRLRNDPGVYVIFGDGAVVYVGSSTHVAGRLKEHGLRRCHSGVTTPWGTFECVLVKVAYTRRFGDWLMREARLIHRLNPTGNTIGTRRINGTEA